MVLSLYNIFKKDKTEYPEKHRVPDITPIFQLELKKAAKAEGCSLIIIENAFKESEEDFKNRFAFIINRSERRIQSLPKTRAKTDWKAIFSALRKGKKPPFHQPETVSYERRKTHVFKLDVEGKTAYTFNYLDKRILALPRSANADNAEELEKKVFELFAKNSEEYPDGYTLIPRELKVTTFFERHIPNRRDNKNELIRKSAMLVAICVFIVAAGMFINSIFIEPMQNEAVQSEIQTIFYQQETDPVTGKVKVKKLNWKELKKINPEIKGWIKVDNTKINYPIVHHKADNKDSQFYLRHNYKQDPSSYGGIFIDWRSKKGLDSKNCIIHGHHMDDGSMFAQLTKYGKYSGDLGFYKKTPTFKISTPKGGTQTYKIISVFKSNVDPHQGEYFDFFCSNFKSKAQFMNYVYNLRVRSLFNCPVSVNEKDRLVTLVTCSYEFVNGPNTFRTVVVARKCRKHESPSVDVSSASLNKNPVWPQCYYSRMGGTRPVVSTFKKALKSGKISWYDGNKKTLKGSEQLPTSLKETTEPTTQPTTAPKPTTAYYTIKVKNLGKVIMNKRVKQGTTVKVPRISNFTKNGYKYTFVKWRAKGFVNQKYLSRTVGSITVNCNVVIAARYKKTKIKTAPKPTTPKATKPKATKPKATKATKPATKPTAKPVVKPTEKPTEPPEEETEALE